MEEKTTSHDKIEKLFSEIKQISIIEINWKHSGKGILEILVKGKLMGTMGIKGN
jgi:hypothetical protein